jgi:hypothetical protein
LFTFRGQIVVFIAILNRSCWAEKECHLSLLEQTKIDQAKNQQSFTSFVYKNASKILKTRKAIFLGRQLSQVASRAQADADLEIAKNPLMHTTSAPALGKTHSNPLRWFFCVRYKFKHYLIYWHPDFHDKIA